MEMEMSEVDLAINSHSSDTVVNRKSKLAENPDCRTVHPQGSVTTIAYCPYIVHSIPYSFSYHWAVADFPFCL